MVADPVPLSKRMTLNGCVACPLLPALPLKPGSMATASSWLCCDPRVVISQTPDDAQPLCRPGRGTSSVPAFWAVGGSPDPAGGMEPLQVAPGDGQGCAMSWAPLALGGIGWVLAPAWRTPGAVPGLSPGRCHHSFRMSINYLQEALPAAGFGLLPPIAFHFSFYEGWSDALSRQVRRAASLLRSRRLPSLTHACSWR